MSDEARHDSVDTVVFDIDGTLVDTNYHHVIAWHRAFRRIGVVVPLWQVHRAIGMGGDMLVGHVAGDAVERCCGDDVRDAWKDEFDKLIDEVQPFPGAQDVIEQVRRRGFRVVLASSGQRDHVESLLDIADVRQVGEAYVTSNDVDRSKPHPDLIQTAVDRVGGNSAMLVGDSIWDCEAGRRAGAPTIAIKSGGFSAAELRDAGAAVVFDSLVDLQVHLDEVLPALAVGALQ